MFSVLYVSLFVQEAGALVTNTWICSNLFTCKPPFPHHTGPYHTGDPARIHLYSYMFKLVYLDLTIQPHRPLSSPAEKSFTRTHTHTYNLSLVRGSFNPADAGLKQLERSLEKRRQRKPAEGCWVKDMWYDVGETFERDGCKDVKCTCHWDGQVSCRQDGNECEFRFFKGITSNDRTFGCPSMYTDTTHNTILFIGRSTMRDTTELIR